MADDRLTHKVAHAILHTAQAGEGTYEAMADAAIAIVRAEEERAADPLTGSDAQQLSNRAEMARREHRHEDARVMVEAIDAVGGLRRKIATLRAEIECIRDVATATFLPASSPRYWMETCADTMERAPDGETPGHRPFTDDGITYCGLDGKDGCGHLWPCPTVRAKAERAVTGTVCAQCGAPVDLDELAERYIRKQARKAVKVEGRPPTAAEVLDAIARERPVRIWSVDDGEWALWVRGPHSAAMLTLRAAQRDTPQPGLLLG